VGIAGLVLTGGSSSRLGRDKGALFGPAVAAVVAEACAPAIEVGPGRTGLPAVADPGLGPLVAVAAAAAAPPLAGLDALVVACDMTLVSADLLRWLATRPGTCVPVVDGRIQPLCARYSAAALARAPGAADAGARRAMRDLLAVADDVHYVEAPAWAVPLFADVDTPDDLARVEGARP